MAPIRTLTLSTNRDQGCGHALLGYNTCPTRQLLLIVDLRTKPGDPSASSVPAPIDPRYGGSADVPDETRGRPLPPAGHLPVIRECEVLPCVIAISNCLPSSRAIRRFPDVRILRLHAAGKSYDSRPASP